MPPARRSASALKEFVSGVVVRSCVRGLYARCFYLNVAFTLARTRGYLRHIDPVRRSAILPGRGDTVDNPPQLFGTPGEAVPTIDAADMMALWDLYEDIRTHSPRSVGVGVALIKSVCSPEADLGALLYRSMMLEMLVRVGQMELAVLRDNEAFRSTVFKVIARTPLTWSEIGVPSNGLPFDVDAFLEECGRVL